MQKISMDLFGRTKKQPQKPIDPAIIQLKTPAEDFVENHVQVNSPRLNTATTPNGPKQSLAKESSEPAAAVMTVAVTTESIPNLLPASAPALAQASSLDLVPTFLTTDTHCAHFRAALSAFESSLPPKHKTHFSPSSHHTWDEVIAEAKIAEVAYTKRGSRETHFGKVRGYLRILQRNTARLDGWIDLAPSQSTYASVICGGFKMVLRAACRMNEIRELVVNALASVPGEIEKAQLMVEYHEGLKASERLCARVAAMYVCVFGVLEHVVRWFGSRSGIRHFKAFLTQGDYEWELEERIGEFREAVRAVKGEADLCSYSRLQDMHGDIKLSRSEGQETGDMIRQLMEFLKSHPGLDPRTGHILPPPSIPSLPPRGKAISRYALCAGLLAYDAEIPRKDLTTMMRYGHELSLKEQDRVIFAIEDRRLKNWLAAPRSSALLIKGNATDLDNSPVCSMSFLAAHIVNSVNALPNSRIICLQWFTSEHRNVRKSSGSVAAIMRSLIGQLVSLYRGFDLYFIKRSTAEAIRDYNDLSVLCDVFDQLIVQLPAKATVICVIDWLARLEYECKEDVRFLVERLHNVSRFAGDQGSRFKLLLTHAGGAFHAATEFADDGGELLVLPEAIAGNRMGFNKTIWDSKAGNEIAALTKREKKQVSR